MIVDPGKLQHYGSLYGPIEGDTDDVRGDENVTYGFLTSPTQAPWKRIWCSIEPVAGREMLVAQQMHGAVTHKITMRYVAGLTKRHVLRWNGRTFNLAPPLTTEEAFHTIQVYATERA